MRLRKREERDFYRTPVECGKAVEHVLQWGGIWEPCAGDGRLLDAWGEKVVMASDIAPQRSDIVKQDFFTATPSSDVEIIATNPPFSLQRKMIEHCIHELRLPCLMLMRIEWMNAKAQRDLQEYVSYEGVMSELVKFETQDGRVVNGNGTCRVAWFMFQPYKCPITMRQKEWLYYK